MKNKTNKKIFWVNTYYIAWIVIIFGALAMTIAGFIGFFHFDILSIGHEEADQSIVAGMNLYFPILLVGLVLFLSSPLYIWMSSTILGWPHFFKKLKKPGEVKK